MKKYIVIGSILLLCVLGMSFAASQIIQSGDGKMKVTVNGKTIEVQGSNVSVVNGVIKVDGVRIDIDGNGEATGEVKIEGNITGGLTCDKSVTVHGDIEGDVKSGGSINCNNIKGNVHSGGSINCDDIAGQVQAGGSINCDDIITR